jgi:DMSO reductase family type II enzyme heme b subunit
MSRARAVTTLLLAFAAAAAPPALQAQEVERGRQLYDTWCAECHGFDGAGEGAAATYMMPRPRDFTLGTYQIRTTANGELPTDEDLARVIERGMPGTAMPGWQSKFSDAEVADLVAYIKSFSRFFEQLGAPDPLEFGRPPRLSQEGLAEGRRFYEEIECFKCHGDAGRGDGTSAPTLQDDLDFPARPADLTESWTFNGGGTVEDIYRRLRTGLDGSPMPSFSDLLDSEFMTEEQLWHLAQYVHSLAPPELPPVREVIAAGRVEGALPESPDDPAWNDVEAFYIPMVGQIIIEPRWFAPTVDVLWVKALHNDEELALRLAWDDPSESPDSAWLEWQGWVAQSVHGADSGVRLLPDRLAVQFPSSTPTGRERPYFLMGDSRRPVYLWQWTSGDEGTTEARATGLGTQQPLAGGELSSAAVWDRGEWRLQFRRSLATADSSGTLQFRQGVAVPIAFFAWDGSNGESGTQMAISSWYSIYLEQPTPSTVYLSPVIAMLATAALGFVVVWRAQRREEDEPSS